jgi:hypothetical protein
LLLITTTLAVIAAIVLAMIAGYYLRDIRATLLALRSRVANLEEDGGLPGSAIVEAKTPKELVEHKFDEPDEESAIVTAKKPGELAREKDRKLQEELDRLGR